MSIIERLRELLKNSKGVLAAEIIILEQEVESLRFNLGRIRRTAAAPNEADIKPDMEQQQ